MKKVLTTLMIVAVFTMLSQQTFAAPSKPLDLLDNGAGESENVPEGLKTAKGIQKQIPLVISNVQATSTNASSTVITWDTNKEADSLVTYWVATTSPTTTFDVYSSSTSIGHFVLLDSLEASTTYEYFVTSEDLYGNSTTSETYIFNTVTVPGIPQCSMGPLSSPACEGVLAIFEAQAGSGTSGGPRPIDSTRAVLVYGLKNFSSSTAPFTMIASSSLGLGYRLEPGQTPTYDLNAFNTPEFDEFVGYMTNGIDENLDAGGIMYTPDGKLITASAGGNWESSEYRFGISPDLQGKEIDFIRFIITKNNTKDGPSGASQELRYIVEIWGGEAPPVSACEGITSITDNRDTDNPTYETVEIGEQCWLKRNLNVGTHVPSITPVPNTLPDSLDDQTDNGIIDKWCYGNDTANCDIYGGLYQWDEAMSYATHEGAQGICPAGWHVPQFSDWNKLRDYLGGEYVAGGKMKDDGTEYWETTQGDGNVGATNSSGFTAFGAGTRGNPGDFSGLRVGTSFWQSTLADASAPVGTYDYNRVRSQSLALGQANASVNDSHLRYMGLSVRCMMD